MTDTAEKPKRSLFKSFRFWSLAILVLILAAGGISFALAKSTPGWYVPFPPRDKDVQLKAMRFRDIDSKVEAKKLDLVSPGNPVAIMLDEETINSVVAVAFDERPNNRIETPVVLFQNGQITIGARVKNIPVIGEGVLNFSFHLLVTPPENAGKDPATRVAVIFDSVAMGNLPIPRSVLLDRIPELAPAIDHAIKLEISERKPKDRLEKIREFLADLAAEKPTPVPYLYPGGQTGKSERPVFLHAIKSENQRLTLIFAAEPLGGTK